MKDVVVIDRKTKKKEKEKIMGHSMILALYGSSFFSKVMAPFLKAAFCRFHFFSKIVGIYQKSSFSKKAIIPFIKAYQVNEKEFQDHVTSFKSFNDFFIRKLKQSARKIESDVHLAVCPADARYLGFQNIDQIEKFWIKGKEFDLKTFLNCSKLAKKYHKGSMVIARLCPSDYHRFHFPVSGVAYQPKKINGFLFSVNPIALFKNFLILQENKREVTEIKSDFFGDVCMVEIGATNVGTIHQTFASNHVMHKGDEKGYFSFGGSCVVLLFEKGKIQLDEDLLENTLKGFETYIQMGDRLGSSQI
jgi:phosphatidylserine decarboxylase